MQFGKDANRLIAVLAPLFAERPQFKRARTC